jgi:hypothetical protein
MGCQYGRLVFVSSTLWFLLINKECPRWCRLFGEIRTFTPRISMACTAKARFRSRFSLRCARKTKKCRTRIFPAASTCACHPNCTPISWPAPNASAANLTGLFPTSAIPVFLAPLRLERSGREENLLWSSTLLFRSYSSSQRLPP